MKKKIFLVIILLLACSFFLYLKTEEVKSILDYFTAKIADTLPEEKSENLMGSPASQQVKEETNIVRNVDHKKIVEPKKINSDLIFKDYEVYLKNITMITVKFLQNDNYASELDYIANIKINLPKEVNNIVIDLTNYNKLIGNADGGTRVFPKKFLFLEKFLKIEKVNDIRRDKEILRRKIIARIDYLLEFFYSPDFSINFNEMRND